MKKMFLKFLKPILITVIGLISILALLLSVYAYYLSESKSSGKGILNIDPGIKKKNVITEIFEPTPPKVNFIVLGVDSDGTRTDFILAGCFKPDTNTLDLVSVPRDTYVVIPEERLKVIKEKSSIVPYNGDMKLCEVYHFSGKELGLEYAFLQIEEELGVDFDYYVKVNFEALKYVVDELGGIEFDVPQRMYYNDPTQDLYIDLYPGVQVLDGDKAEQLVRYRKADEYNPISKGYASDVERMAVQQNFIKAVIKKSLSSENILKSIPTIASTAYKYIETNFSLAEVTKYLKYVADFSVDNINTYTIPSRNKIINGKSYETLIESEKNEIIKKAFFTEEEMLQMEKESKNKKIQVLNGGYTSGIAAKTKEKLVNAGFTVSSIGDYEGEKGVSTRIIVKKEGHGEDLKQFFLDSNIEVLPEYTSDYDIVIIIGTIEKLD